MVIQNYKNIMSLQTRIDEMKKYLELLNKYMGEQETIDRAKIDLKKLYKEFDEIIKRKFYCQECGNVLNKEERIYMHLTGMGGEGTPYYVMWDTYICKNCGFFTWDDDSARNLNEMIFNNPFKDPRYHGTMDGHPKFDPDNDLRRKLELDEEDLNKL
jgi:hypothetical protein